MRGVVLTEKQWQRQLTDLARVLGWRTYHTFLSRWSDSGFPDLVLVRDRVIFIECKRSNGQPTAAQAEWLEALAEAGAETYLWTPADFDEAQRVLQR